MQQPNGFDLLTHNIHFLFRSIFVYVLRYDCVATAPRSLRSLRDWWHKNFPEQMSHFPSSSTSKNQAKHPHHVHCRSSTSPPLSSMPSYYFHLKLELYSQPAASKRRKLNPTSPSTTTTATTPYLPPPGADIFKHPLPAHKTSKWSSYTFTKSPRPDTPTTASTSSERSNSPRQIPPSEFTESHGDALLLPERTLNRQTVPKSPALVKPAAKPSNETAARDWRYGAVSLESIDMEVQKKSGGGVGLHTKAVYLPGEPRTTEVGWGVVHLYRDSEESGVLESDGGGGGRKSLDTGRDGGFDTEDCTTLCILAVPSWMMPSDLLGFVGDQAREDVSHFRLIRTGRANKYMVLMKFRSPKRAREWQKAYNGRLFSAAEPENCHVVFIKSVEFISPESDDEVGDGKSFPENNQHDPFTPHGNGTIARSKDSKSLTSKPMAPPPPNLLELPTCPVCLERMDETTGLLTILCQHVFHCACLEKWRFPGSGCPVCRYTQSPSYTFPYPRNNAGLDEETEPLCSVCATDLNLWICLICGNIGCGRYDSAHAYAHYEATSHCYAMDLSTQHVWDYAGDGYVHRLIQSKPDFSSQQQQASSHSKHSSGSLDYAGAARQRHENEAYRAEAQDMVPREKMESMANEYTYLLTSQLEGQRRYFEEQVERAVDKASQATLKAEAAAAQADSASTSAAAAETERATLRDQLARLEANLTKTSTQKSKFESLARDLSAQLREEKTMNEGLLKRIQAADEKAEKASVEAEKARGEVRELQDVNHDLTSFISGQEKVRELQAAGEEVEEGGVGVVEKEKKVRKGKGRKK